MNDHKNDRERIYHIRDAVLKITSFTTGFNEENYLSNALVQSAVERQLEIIGEASFHLSEEIKDKYAEVEWNKIKSFRNFIAHEYFGVSPRRIWVVVVRDLPLLEKSICKIILDNNW